MKRTVGSKKGAFLLLALVLRTDAGGAGMRGDRSMAHLPRRKSDAARRANQVIRSRTVLVMLLLGIVTFAVLFWKLYDIQIRQHSVLQEKAIEQQTRSAVVNASRGTVYDRNLNTLAISATAEDVNISPMRIAEFVESQKEKQEKAAKKAADKGETYTAPILRDQAYIAKGLSRILGVEQETLETRMTKTNYDYWNIKKRADQTVSDEVRRFINGEIDPDGNEVPESDRVKLQGVWLQPSSKRYYLYGSLASGVLGFVNSDGVGSVGLEAKYDDTLTGTAGYTISARNAAGTELMYNYEQIFDAENGHSLVLTLDANVQMSLENGLESMLKKYGAKNGGTGIVMDVNSGAIVAMASYPNYDLNDYGTIFDDALKTKLDTELAKIDAKRSTYESEEAYAEARSAAINSAVQSQWRNKCIDSTYEPGSTYKPITLAAALEEGKVTKNSTFYCSGSTRVQGWNKAIWCSNHSGHGQQTLIEAVGHSCNPAFISMGLSVGTETYYKYLKSFGLMDKTGMTAKEMDTYMNKKSGMLGISGISSDFRDLGAAAEKGDERAKLALDMFVYAVKKYIGSYAAALNGADAIVFTAGVGENDREVRADILKDMEYMGIVADFDYNMTCPRGEEVCISKPESKVKIFVIPTDEEMTIARDTARLVTK